MTDGDRPQRPRRPPGEPRRESLLTARRRERTQTQTRTRQRDTGASGGSPLGRLAEPRARRRAVSRTLDYTLTLAIATIVITGLFIAASDFVSDQRERVVRTELSVIGQRIATDVNSADRLVAAGRASQTDLTVHQSLPAQVTGSTYTVEVAEQHGNQWINLTTASLDVSVSVRVNTTTPLTETAIGGGEVSVVYDSGANELEVTSG